MSKSMPFQNIILNQLQIPTKLLSTYKELGLNEQEVMVILQLQRFLQDKNDFPTPTELASYVTMSEKECADVLRKLIQKQLLTIKEHKNSQNQLSEAYCLNPLWEKLFIVEEPKQEPVQSDGTIFVLFEQEFGRPLSPFEIEMVSSWLDEDQFAAELIKAGLRESVLMGKLNFTYIDRILRDWQKKGIRSVDQARESSRAFRNRQGRKEYKATDDDENNNKSLYYNWLEGDD
ncbi:MAG TPA: DnaD domain-containing protein [Virgibacillus sp.]|nr:DnaD domain-containing protein [Virgibacillus sp.]